MASAQTPDPMTAEAAGRLAEFARACKAAIRVVAMYPPTHPNIQAALDRMTAAGAAATARGPLTLSVRPDTILIEGRVMPRADAAVDELAALLHRHQVGEITFQAPLSAGAWHLLLSLLAAAPEEVRADGGLGEAWAAAGGGPVEIREIDYAEVLKERHTGADGEVEWADLIATCLAGDESSALDERTLASLLDIARDPERLAEFIHRLQERARTSGQPMEARKRTLRRLLQGLADHAARQAPDEFDEVMDNVASGTTRLDPESMLSLLTGGPAEGERVTDGVDLSGELRARFTDDKLAAFVAENVIRDRGATGRLAEAFNALAPTETQRSTALALAEERVSMSPLGEDTAFNELWTHAVNLLMSYSDEDYVPDAYDRELTMARERAVEIEQISDDPPDRIAAWLATVADSDLRALDQQLLVDLLRLEDRPDAWGSVLELALSRLDQLLLVSDLPLASDLAGAIIGVADDPHSPFASRAREALDGLIEGPLASRLLAMARVAAEAEVPRIAAFCQMLGPAIVPALIAALSTEENRLAVRRIRDVLVGFGAAAREPAKALRNATNPAVRRAAIEILRAVGGDEALDELRTLLADPDPHVQREALRAIIQIGSDEAYAMLESALASGEPATRRAMLQALGAFTDARAVPLLTYLIEHSSWRGEGEATYVTMIEALGRSGADPRGIALLTQVLYRGEWWAPGRTRRLRSAAARALQSTASPAGDAVLEEAARGGPRGVRRAAAEALAMPRRPRPPGATR